MTRRRSLRLYRAVVQVLPRAHRERFGADQTQLAQDLLETGEPAWRLWLGLPGDVVAVHRSTRRRPAVLQPAGGPAASGWQPARAVRMVRTGAFATFHTCWLAAHVGAGVAWQVALALAPGVAPIQLAQPDQLVAPLVSRLAGLVEALTITLTLTFPIAVVTFWWLPRRTRFAVAWLILWPLGMLLLRGLGDYLFE